MMAEIYICAPMPPYLQIAKYSQVMMQIQA